MDEWITDGVGVLVGWYWMDEWMDRNWGGVVGTNAHLPFLS